jgi:hypothetical protein
MKRITILTAIMALAGLTVSAADSPKDAITNATKALSAKANYSWKATVVVPEGTPFSPGPTEGQTEKDGYTVVKMSMMDNAFEGVIKGDKFAFKGEEGWQSEADLANAQGPGQFMGRMFHGYKTPAAQAQELAAGIKELKKDGDVYSGDLTEDAVKAQLSFGGPGPGGQGPAITNPKGSAKFWIKDGVLDKYEIKVAGSMDFGGNSMAMDRDTTVVIKDVGTTKVTVSDDAKKKIQ